MDEASEGNYMHHLYIIFLLLLAGLGVSVQGTMNGGLGKIIGPPQAAFFLFWWGQVVCLFFFYLSGKAISQRLEMLQSGNYWAASWELSM